MLGSAQAWSAKHNRIGEWLGLDLQASRLVRGTVVQRRGSSYGRDQWIKRYTVKYGTDRQSWTQVPGVFTGVGTSDAKAEGIFPAVVTARYLRLVVLDWNVHISMRADALLTCSTCNATT